MKELYSMKINKMPGKIGLILMAVFMSLQFALAQDNERAGQPTVFEPGDVAPGVTFSSSSLPSTQAMWDVQFRYSATDSTGGARNMGGACFFNNEFWISRWDTNIVYRCNINGSLIQTFVIAGLTGTRSLTTDGTYIYAGNVTNTIYRIDPVTRTLAPPHINSASSNTIRHCSYDPTLDSGNGGFWIGNFGTSIDAVSRTGAVLSSIPTTTHGLTGMYGSAYESFTTGSPYLWVFCQSGANNMEIFRLNLPSGTPLPFGHNVMSDIGVATGFTQGLARGLFVSDQIVPGQKTLGGIVQGTAGAMKDMLFGYELNDIILPPYDAALSGLRSIKGYSRVPLAQVAPQTYIVNATNYGVNSIDTLKVRFTVEFGGSNVFTGNQQVLNVAPAANVTLNSTAFTPANGVGTYNVMAVASIGANQTDSVAANDTTRFSFMVTDSTYARDDDNPSGTGYNVSTTSWAYAVTNFEVVTADTLSSVWIRIQNPRAGDTTYVVVATTSAGVPNALLWTGPPVILTTANTYVLPIPGGLRLNAGTYAIGCYEGSNTVINLSQSANYFTQGMNYFFTPAGGWTQSGILTARFIRPNFGIPVGVGVDDAFGESSVAVYPNPNAGNFTVRFQEGFETEVTVSVLNMLGKEVRNMTVNPTLEPEVLVNLEKEASGVYFVRVIQGDQSLVRKVMISR